MVVNLPLFILQHNGMHAVKIVQYMSVYICKEKLEFVFRRTFGILAVFQNFKNLVYLFHDF